MLDDEIIQEEQMITPKIIVESKPYIYKENLVEWINYVKDSIKTSPRYIQEFRVTVAIMKKLGDNELSMEEAVDLLKKTDYSVESMYHIVNNILYYYKDGPLFFKTFYKGYMNPQLERLIEEITIRNMHYKDNDNIESQTKRI